MRKKSQSKSELAKDKTDLQRREASKELKTTVLIVCEGKKTEPYYFRELARSSGLSTRQVQTEAADITIDGNCGSAPKNVVEHGISLFNQDPTYNFIFFLL